MTQDNLFQTNEHVDLPPVIDENKNYLTELVGDGKKFKTAEDMAKGKYLADQTLDLYKRRMDEMRIENERLLAESRTKARLEELVDQLSAKPPSSEQPPANESQPKPIDITAIENQVLNKLEQRETSKKQTENFNTVMSKLKEQYGSNYQSVLEQQILQLGLTPADVNDLAKKSPTAFFKAMGLEKQDTERFQTPIRSQQRSDNFSPSGTKKRTWQYYQELKKVNPNLYFDRNTAVQMTKDAVELGDAFRDGNYFVKGLHDE